MADQRVSIGASAQRWIDGRFARREISASTHESYGISLRMLATHLGPDMPVADVTRDMIEDWLAGLRSRWGGPLAPASLNARATAVKSFFADECGSGRIGRDPARQIRRARLPKRPPRWVPPEQVAAILAAAPLRAQVIVVLGVQLGLRIGEIRDLHVEDWDRQRRFLRVSGKGSKDRVLPVTDEATEALTLWLSDGRTSGPMWPTPHKRRRAAGLGITSDTIARSIAAVVAQLPDEARTGQRITSHAFRHTAATDTLRSGASFEVLRRMLGHESYGAIQHYVSVQPEDLRSAMDGRRYQGSVLVGTPRARQGRRRRRRPRR